jgi:DNA ligase-1
VEDTIDAVILGYYTGQGKRSGFGIGAFLVGIYNEKEDIFQTIAKVGTGLTDQEWIIIRTACDKIKVSKSPANVQVPKELAPDVWVNPEIVCEIRCDNITKSPLHTAGKSVKDGLGYALRFPRFLGYRKDKSAFQATTVQEIVHLYEQQFVSEK